MKLFDYVKTIIVQDSPFKFLLTNILIRSKLSTFLTLKRKGYRLRFYPSANSRLLWINKNYENPVLGFIHDYLRNGDIVIDAGANIGVITLESSIIVGNSGKVYSIEPHPKTFRFLKGNIQLNKFDNIEIFNVVLGNVDKIVLFSDKISDDQNSVSNDENGIKLPMKSLDNLIHSNQINLLKIDVEGYEKFVLLGCIQLLKLTDCVCFEVVEKSMQNQGYSIEDIYDIFFKNEFQLFRFKNKQEISSITKFYRPLKTGEDLLAIKNIDDFLKRTNYKIILDEQ